MVLFEMLPQVSLLIEEHVAAFVWALERLLPGVDAQVRVHLTEAGEDFLTLFSAKLRIVHLK